MPDPEKALRHVLSLLKPGSRIYFTQTFEKKRAVLLEYTKPLFQYITTIDFGSVGPSPPPTPHPPPSVRSSLTFLVCVGHVQGAL